ncbi:hypothetical protein NIES932_27510 [Raphidiopsis curvata NIES-932]|nr:hypothetical protein NIES932_27510 [Raphidiopsis curvata NIES-932]
MTVWLICFFLLFAIAEVFSWAFDWLGNLSLPLPIHILAGSFLAVASNYDKILGTDNYHGELLPRSSTFDNATSEISISSIEHD